MSEQTIIPSFAGLDVNDNQNISPQGSLIQALDVVCDKPGVIESGHSFNTFRAAIADNITNNYQYEDPTTGVNRMLLYTDANKLYYDNGSAFTAKSGTYSIPIGASTIRGLEENKSFYFTEQSGVKVIDSVAATPIPAGIPRCLDPSVNVTGQYSFTNGDIIAANSAANGDSSSVSCVDSVGNTFIAFCGETAGKYYIQKYDISGNLLWRVSSSGTNDQVSSVMSISVDSQDNIYLSGSYGPGGTGGVNNRYITGAVGAIVPLSPYIVSHSNSDGSLRWTCVMASTTAAVSVDFFTRIYVDNRAGFNQVYIGLNGNNPSLAVGTFVLQYNVSSSTGTGTTIATYNRNCPIIVGFTSAGALFFNSTAYTIAAANQSGNPIKSLSGYVINGLLTLSVSMSTTGIAAWTFNAQTIPTNSLVVFRLYINAAAPATARVLTFAQNRTVHMAHQDLSDGTTDTVFFVSRSVSTAQITSFTSVATGTATPAALTNISAEISTTATIPATTSSNTILFNYITQVLYMCSTTSNGVNGSSLLGINDQYIQTFAINSGTWALKKTQQYGGTSLYTNQMITVGNLPQQTIYIRPSDGQIVVGGIVSNFGSAASGLYGKPFISTATSAGVGDYYCISIDQTALNKITIIEYGATTTTASSIYIGTHSFVVGDVVVLQSTGTLPSPLISGNPYVVSVAGTGFISITTTYGGTSIQLFPFISTAIHYVRYATQPAASFTNGFLPNNKEVRYRAIIGRIDANNYLKLGPPSGESFQVPNLYANLSTVNLTVPIPSGLDTTYFVEIYRSLQTTFPTPPTDELFLAQKHQLTNTDISNGYVTFTDTVSENNLGATLYTSPSQEGIINENDQPPIACDIAFYKGLTLYANTKYKQRFVFTFAWKNITDGTNLTLTNTYNILRITQGITSFDTYLVSGVGTVPSGNFYYENNGDPTYCAYRSALNMVTAINSNGSNTLVKAYLINVDGGNASILLEALNSGGAAIVASTPYQFTNYPLIVYDNPNFSDNAATNRIIVSKSQQPDAVPLGNTYDVGPAGSTIKRIIPMRNSIFVLSDQGTYQILGNTLDQFQTNNYNLQMRILPGCDSTAIVLDNILYFLSNNFVVACNETSFDMIGKPIQPILEQAGAYTSVIAAYGVADKTNNRYMLIYNMDTVSGTNQHCVIYIYSTYTNQWTIWTKSANCGIVIDDTLYLAYDPVNVSTAQAPKQVYIESDTFTITDYAVSAPNITLKMFSMDNFAINKQFVKLYLQFQNPYPGTLTLTTYTEVEGNTSTFPVTIQTTNTSGTWVYDKLIPGIVETDLAMLVGRMLYVNIVGPNNQNLTLNGAWVQWNPYSEAP